MRVLLAIVILTVSIWVLERARVEVAIERFTVADTPVTRFLRPGADGPPVVIAHGFAGSSQMMQGYALPLARAGYRVFAFDFLGHGRHPVPMSGDVTSVDGTTRLLVEQVETVMDAVAAEGETVALLGHSMATDVLVRVAARQDATGPMVLLSAFSQEIDATHPRDLLLVVGQWEPGLREFALDAARMVMPDATEGETVVAGPVRRRAVVAPFAEHVSILQNRLARDEALTWLDQSFGRQSDHRIWPTGIAIVGVLAGLVALATWGARHVPMRDVPAASLTVRQLAVATLLPAIVTPPIALILDPGLMPVLVADYLGLHLAIYGAVQLVLLRIWRVAPGGFSPAAFVTLLVACAILGAALDRYAANFWPTGARVWIIAVLSVGAVLYFLADARLAHRASIGRRLALHGAFLGSLVFAVGLDFERLFFLMMIAPVIVLFYLVFGTMGHAVSGRAGPSAPGLALGLVLAWALGVSFPLFQG